MELILWRHAEAEEGIPDLSRQLTERGRRQAAEMAAWLRAKLPENALILSSPAVRAQQTAAALCRNFEIVSALRPGASVDQLLDAASWPYANRAVVVVGHQPTLGDVAHMILSEMPPGLHFKTGTVWWLSCLQNEEVDTIQLYAVKYPDAL